jgi:hypothetical protein
MLGRLIPTVMAWLGVVVTLALAPQIETYNGYVTTNVSAAVNSASMIGMTAIDDFGGFIMVMLLLVGTGLFAFAATKMKNLTIQDIISNIGAVIIAIIILAFFSGSVIGYYDALITAGSGVAQTFYGVMTTLTYVIIIGGGGGWNVYKAYRKARPRRKKRTYSPV